MCPVISEQEEQGERKSWLPHAWGSCFSPRALEDPSSCPAGSAPESDHGLGDKTDKSVKSSFPPTVGMPTKE